MTPRLLTAAVLAAALLASAAPSHAESSDVTFAKGLDAHEMGWVKRPVGVTFGDEALTLTIKGSIRVMYRTATTTLTIPYTDLLSATYEEGPFDGALVLRYRRDRDGEVLRLEGNRKLAQRVVATLEARTSLRVTKP